MEKIVKQGWVVITPTLCQGDVMGWHTEDDNGKPYPLVYDTKEAACKDLAELMITELKQFIDGERELDSTRFSTDEYPAMITIYEDGSFAVLSEGSEDMPGDIIIESTLEEWSSNL